MAVVVFLRGVNVGGHRRFRPSEFARSLDAYDVVNIGAAGTFVVRKPPTRTLLRAAFARALPFETHVMMCEGREILALESADSFDAAPTGADVVRFVSVLPSARRRPPTPVTIPERGAWSVRLLGARGQFVFGVYRRQMRAIRDLGRLDEVLGAPVTTRNWNTILAIGRVVRDR